MTLRTRALVLICPLFLASMQLIGSEVKQVTSTKQLNSRLFTAIEDANIDQVRALLVKGADIEAKSLYDRTPLIRAAYKGNTEVCKIVILCCACLPTNESSTTKNLSFYIRYSKLMYTFLTSCCAGKKHTSPVKPLRENLKLALLIFHKYGLPRDIRHKILKSNPQVYRELLRVLSYDYCHGLSLNPSELAILRQFYSESIPQLKQAMQEALSHASTNEIRELLDPEALEDNFEQFSKINKLLE